MENKQLKNKHFKYDIKQFKLDLIFGFCAVISFAIDQFTKKLVIDNIPVDGKIELIPDFLYITHIKNSGAAFGILQNHTDIFIIISFIAIILILVLKVTLNINSVAYNLALGLILGGAVGNLFDRFLLGEVTDFIYFTFFAVFNGADSFIVIGFFILAIVLIKDFLKKSKDVKE